MPAATMGGAENGKRPHNPGRIRVGEELAEPREPDPRGSLASRGNTVADPRDGEGMRPYACRNCRRPLHWTEGIGWLHGELPQYADEPVNCERPHPSCMYSTCDHTDGPNPSCACPCHVPGSSAPMNCAKHKGHKRYVGGCMDGHVGHLIHACPSDYPETFGTTLRSGTRSWYRIDREASEGTEVVYRFVGLGRTCPDEREDRG